jgi:hypothetical protein
MKKFMVIYHAPQSADQNMQMGPEDGKKEMEKWMTWANKIGTGLVDLGTPLGNGKKVTKSGSTQASDKNVVGYSVLQAESMEAALEMVKDHPHLSMPGACEIEVHESLSLPGM